MIPENNNPDTSAEIAALKNQVFTLLVALIVVSGTLSVYLYRQVSLAGKDLQSGQQLSATLTKNENAIGTLVGELINYGQKDPKFVPVLKKYGLGATTGLPGMPLPAAAPSK